MNKVWEWIVRLFYLAIALTILGGAGYGAWRLLLTIIGAIARAIKDA